MTNPALRDDAQAPTLTDTRDLKLVITMEKGAALALAVRDGAGRVRIANADYTRFGWASLAQVEWDGQA